MRATPSNAAPPIAASIGRGRRPAINHDSADTRRGCNPPAAAATPPGSRYTATASSGKKMPKLNNAKVAVRRHSTPCGRQRDAIALPATNASPAGSTRMAATNSGRPAAETRWW